MKILIISDAWLPQLNGVVRTYQHLKEELEKIGHEVKVIGPRDFPLRFAMPGYKEIELVFRPYKRLKAMIRTFAPDHVHIATEGPLGGGARRYCRRRDFPFTTSYHTHFPDYFAKRISKCLPFLYKPARRSIIQKLRRFHNKSSAVFVATQSLEDELRSWGFKAPMFRLSRGVSDVFKPEGERVMQGLQKPIALYVGRIAVEKNLDAFLSMDWDGSKVLIGHGPATEKLKTKYPEAYFIGKKEREELAKHYRSSDIFIFPSKTDTFGIVIIEALASGIPVAGHDVTGPRDIITEPLLGALNNDLSVAAKEALTHKGTPQERHEYVHKHYSWPAVAQEFLRTIETALIIRK